MPYDKTIKITMELYKRLATTKAEYIRKHGKNITFSELIEVKKI